MIFSKQELICFNSVLDGKTIFGTRFSAPDDAGDAYINETVASLKKKECVDSNGDPLPQFIAATKMLETYKSARTHIFLNRSRIALAGENVVVLAPVEAGYELMYMNKILFLQSLVLGTPILQKASDKNEANVSKKVEPKEWAKTIRNEDIIDASFWVHKFSNRVLQRTCVLYSANDQGYIYEVAQKELKTCSARDMRMTLIEMLDIDISVLQSKGSVKKNV